MIATSRLLARTVPPEASIPKRVAAIAMGLTLACAALAVADAPLPDAAQVHDWQRLSGLLEEGADPRASQPDGMTALHWAALHGNEQATAELLARGAEADAATRYGVTPLAIACRAGHAEIVNQLLEAGGDANRESPGGETPLMTAARNGEAAIIRALANAGAAVDATERGGQTALMWAASAGNLAAVDALLDAGAAPDVASRGGFTALMFAARDGRLPVVNRLLEAGVNVNAALGKSGGGNERGPRARTSPLLFAVESGHFELALRLVDAGADPNDQASGFAPLHVLSWVRRPELGDNPRGDPPPRGSGSVPALEFVAQLVERGANVNLRLVSGKAGAAELSPKGATPFLLAAKTVDLPLMQALLDAGADPSVTTADGTTPLMAAAGVGAKSVGEHPGTEAEVLAAVRMLVQLGADVNAVDAKRQTAMHGAAYRNYPEVVALLAELGADPKVWNIKNHHGSTPIEVAEGKRPGSLKPSPLTVAALHAALVPAE